MFPTETSEIADGRWKPVECCHGFSCMACHWKGSEMARCLVETNVEKIHGVWQSIVIVPTQFQHYVKNSMVFGGISSLSPKKTSSIIEVNDVKRLLMSSHLGNYHHMDSSLLHRNHLGVMGSLPCSLYPRVISPCVWQNIGVQLHISRDVGRRGATLPCQVLWWSSVAKTLGFPSRNAC